jgi:undecaprenyl-diphosphatase
MRLNAHSMRSNEGTFRDRHPRQFNHDRLALARGTTGLGIAALALLGFSLLFMIVRRNRSAATDAAITLRLQKRDHPYFDRLMNIVSWPGFPPQSRFLPPSIAASLWFLGFRLEAVFQLLAWGTGGISFMVKRVMRRSRPGPATPQIRIVVANIGGSSFPSGHVLNYMGVYGFLTYLAFTWIRPRTIRRIVISVTSVVIGLVGPSRIYLGHHWFTDVLASYLLGTAYLIGLSGLYRRLRMRLSGLR